MDITEADEVAMRAAVSRQIEAFRADDGGRAFAIAAPSIQQHFGTVERFMRMVTTAYRPVYRPRSVVFEPLTWMQSYPALPVILLGEAGDLYRAYYLMQLVAGQWRIAGCYLVVVTDESD